MKKTPKLLVFTPSGVQVVKPVLQERYIDEALEYVLATLQGYHPYYYKRVQPVRLNGYNEICFRISKYQSELMQPELLDFWEKRLYHKATDEQSLRATNLRAHLRLLKRKLKTHVQFDRHTFDNMKANYHKLKNYLAILSQQGYIRSYTLLPDGRFKINWFDSWESSDLQVIEQGWTFERARDKAPADVRIEYDDKVPLLLVSDMYSPDRSQTKDGSVIVKPVGSRDPIPDQKVWERTHNNSSGGMDGKKSSLVPGMKEFEKTYLPRSVKQDKTDPYANSYRPYKLGLRKFKDDVDDKANW